MSTVVRVLFSYDASEDRELTMREGDLITVLTEDASGWWTGTLNGNVGVFPSNYTEVVTQAVEQPKVGLPGMMAGQQNPELLAKLQKRAEAVPTTNQKNLQGAKSSQSGPPSRNPSNINNNNNNNKGGPPTANRPAPNNPSTGGPPTRGGNKGPPPTLQASSSSGDMRKKITPNNAQNNNANNTNNTNNTNNNNVNRNVNSGNLNNNSNTPTNVALQKDSGSSGNMSVHARRPPPTADPSQKQAAQQQQQQLQQQQQQQLQQQQQIQTEADFRSIKEQQVASNTPLMMKQVVEETVEKKFVKTLYDYVGNSETELSFGADNVIEVLQDSDPSGWWQGSLNGAVGWFPSNFVEVIASAPAPSPTAIPVVETMLSPRGQTSQPILDISTVVASATTSTPIS